MESSLESELIPDINISTSGQTNWHPLVYCKSKPMIFRCVCVLALTLAGVMSAAAEVSFSLTIWRESRAAYQTGYGQTRYYAWPNLSDTATPLSHHRVESPAGACSATFGTNTDSTALVFASAAQLLTALTNGNWNLWLNRDTPQEEQYTFTLITSNIDSNSLGPVVIAVPANGGINVISNTAYAWSGPVGYDEITARVRDSQTNVLAATETNWTSGPLLNPGTNFFSVIYGHDISTDCVVSTPTNDWSGVLTNWTVNFIRLQSKAESGFLTEGLAPTPLALALDAPGMIWDTGGAAAWLAQSTNTTDAVDAVQSGPILDGESTTLRTVIYGTNTISFAWRSDCEGWADYVEFSDNGNYVADLTGINGWEQFTYRLADGVVHVLEWTYNKDSSDAEGADAAFLDQVRLGPDTLPSGPPLQFNLSLRRDQKPAHDLIWSNQLCFAALPSLNSPVAPLSYHEVISPHAWYSATFGPTNTSVMTTWLNSFDDLQNELTNGAWTLWLDRETPQAQFFHFTVVTPNLTSNDLTAVAILTPLNNSAAISPQVAYQWTGGLPGADELLVSAYQSLSNDFQFIYATELLFPPMLTTWAGGPALAEGLNFFQVCFTRFVTSNFLCSVPFTGWQLGTVRYESSASSSFTVSNAFPVQILNPQHAGNAFQFEFLSQIGFTNIIQSRTNLVLGDWVDRTNLLGDGTLKTVVLPGDNLPVEFFRITTR